MTPSTANTLGIIGAAFICTLAVSVMIQPAPKSKEIELANLIEKANREADEYHARQKQKQQKRNRAWTKAEKDAAYAALFTGYGYDR